MVPFEITKAGKYTFAVQFESEITSCRMIIMKQGKFMNYISGTKGEKQRDTYIDLKNISIGKYFIFVDIDDSVAFNIGCYGPE